VLEKVEVLMTRKAFADFIARARDALGITQVQLAHLVDVESQQISRWENGRSLPASRKLRRLATALELSDADRAHLHELHSLASEEDKDAALRGQGRIIAELKEMGQQIDQLVADVAELKRAVVGSDGEQSGSP
jgi:transcriptional regulator with XRE-family HTH domain